MQPATPLEAAGVSAIHAALTKVDQMHQMITRLTLDVADLNRRVIILTAQVTRNANRTEDILATLAEVEALVDETRKDVTRLIAAFQAAQTTIPPAAQAQIDVIAGKLGITDADIEAAVPEPPVEPEPPTP